MRKLVVSTLFALCSVLSWVACKSNDIATGNGNTTIGQQCNAAAGSSDAGGGACVTGAVCSVNYCRTACTTDHDCNAGSVCLSGAGGGGCRLDSEAACSASKPCTTPGLVCGSDNSCRNFCNANTPCAVPGDACASDGTCHGPGGSTGDGGGSQDGAGPDGDATVRPGSDGGADTGSSVVACTMPQTQFNFVAQGDANMNFTSGVGVRTATQLVIFSGYTLGASDAGDAGDAGTGNEVFVQAFDLGTAKSLGPAAPLFAAPDGPQFTVDDISIAPTGQIALLFSLGSDSNGNQNAIYASFLTSDPSDGGPGIQFQRTVQIESASGSGPSNYPHVIWSVADSAFLASWDYQTGGSWFLKVRKFSPDGRGAGGTDAVPAPLVQSNTDRVHRGGVGTSGNLLAFPYTYFQSGGGVGPGVGHDFMPIIDAQGNQVGSLVQLDTAMGLASTFVTVGGTSAGFVALLNPSNPNPMVCELFIPRPDVDAGVDAGVDGGAFASSCFASTAREARSISDDTGGAGGVGTVLLDSNGASFFYVNKDGMTHTSPSSVISNGSTSGNQVAVTNFRGSFGVSLYSSASHSTQMAASGCQ